MAAGRDQWLARPGAGVTYAVVFGLLGRHPIAAYLVSTALVAAAAELLRRLLASLRVPPPIALATALVWVALPNHGSLLYWPSASNITLALVLLLAGLSAGERPPWVQPVLLAASVLCYEATLPAAIVGAVVVSRLRTGRWTWTPLLRAAPLLVTASVWMIVFFHPAKRSIDHTADLTLMLPAHFGWGVFAWRPLANLAGVAFAAAAAIVLARRRPLGVEGWLLTAGLATIVIGTMPFVRYFYAPLGAGDRVNVVAAVGAAMAWTAMGALLSRRLPVAAASMAAVLVIGVAAEQVEAARAWHAAARDAKAIARDIEGGATVVVQPPLRRNVAAVLDVSNVDGMAALVTGRRDADVRLVRPASSPRPRLERAATAAPDGSPRPAPCSACRW